MLSAGPIAHLDEGSPAVAARLSPARPLRSPARHDVGEVAMKHKLVGGVALAVFALITAGNVVAQDKESQVQERRDFMKSLGKRMGVIKAFTEGKADLAAASQSGQELAQLVPQITDKFPVNTSMANFPGK